MARILVVAYDDAVRELLCAVVQSAGHDACGLRNTAEALAALSPGLHDLVVIDVRMPEGGGHDVAEKEKQLKVKALLISGHPDDLAAVDVALPFKMSEFEQALHDRLSR